MLIHPGIEFKSVKAHALHSDGDFREPRPDLGVEEIATGANVVGRIAQTNDARQDHRAVFFGQRWPSLLSAREPAHAGANVVAGFGSRCAGEK